VIVGIVILLLAAASVQVRRALNAAAMFVVAMPLESPSRRWRMVGLVALAAVLVACWTMGTVILRVVRYLP
jgi:hypothetical protein